MTTPVRVLQSFKTPRSTTNPYIHMLRQRLIEEQGVEVIDFDWRTALVGRYDVFHMHWPDVLVSGRRPLTRLVRQLFFLLILLRARLLRTALVRTQHNVGLPSGISRRETALLKLADRLTTLRITLNAHTPIDDRQPYDMIPHGHYRDWFAEYRRAEQVPGRLACVGLIRPYKGIDQLVDAFRATGATIPEMQLRIAGQPTSRQLQNELQDATRADSRISLRFEFLGEDQFVQEVSAGELVVLPYPTMHNSGAALAALSLDRPILVPDNEVNRDLAEEVGDGWVYLFRGAIAPDDLTRALTRLRSRPPEQPPDLAGRGWDEVGMRHLTAYRRAVAISHSRQVWRH